MGASNGGQHLPPLPFHASCIPILSLLRQLHLCSVVMDNVMTVGAAC